VGSVILEEMGECNALEHDRRIIARNNSGHVNHQFEEGALLSVFGWKRTFKSYLEKKTLWLYISQVRRALFWMVPNFYCE
jgi:hypothetical protein